MGDTSKLVEDQLEGESLVSRDYSGLERVLELPRLNQKHINPEYLAETASLDAATEELFNVGRASVWLALL